MIDKVLKAIILLIIAQIQFVSCRSEEDEPQIEKLKSKYVLAFPTGETEVTIRKGETINIKGYYFPHIQLCTTAPIEEIGFYTWFKDLDGRKVFQYEYKKLYEYNVEGDKHESIFRPEDLVRPPFDKGTDRFGNSQVFIHQEFEYEWLEVNHSPQELVLKCKNLNPTEDKSVIYLVFFQNGYYQFTYNNVLTVTLK